MLHGDTLLKGCFSPGIGLFCFQETGLDCERQFPEMSVQSFATKSSVMVYFPLVKTVCALQMLQCNVIDFRAEV